MSDERVMERRRLTIDDALALARVLSRQAEVARDLARAFRTGDPDEGVVAFVRALAILPELVPWIAHVYDIDEATFRAEPVERVFDYVEGLVRGDDWASFFERLQRYLRSGNFSNSL